VEDFLILILKYSASVIYCTIFKLGNDITIDAKNVNEI
jgi:hypothetical protein